MKPLRITLLATVATLAVACPNALPAADAPLPPAPGAPPPAFAPMPGPPRGQAFDTSRVLQMMDRKLKLNDEQKAKVEALLETSRKEMREQAEAARKQLKATREGVDAILTPEQKKELESLPGGLFERLGAGPMAGGRGPMGEPGAGMRHQAGGPMGMMGGAPEPKADVHSGKPDAPFGAVREAMRMRQALGGLDLNDEQKTKLKELHKEIGERVEQLQKEAQEKIDQVLTPEQRQKFEKSLREMPAPGNAMGPGMGRGMMRGGPDMMPGMGPKAMRGKMGPDGMPGMGRGMMRGNANAPGMMRGMGPEAMRDRMGHGGMPGMGRGIMCGNAPEMVRGDNSRRDEGRVDGPKMGRQRGWRDDGFAPAGRPSDARRGEQGLGPRGERARRGASEFRIGERGPQWRRDFQGRDDEIGSRGRRGGQKSDEALRGGECGDDDDKPGMDERGPRGRGEGEWGAPIRRAARRWMERMAERNDDSPGGGQKDCDKDQDSAEKDDLGTSCPNHKASLGGGADDNGKSTGRCHDKETTSTGKCGDKATVSKCQKDAAAAGTMKCMGKGESRMKGEGCGKDHKEAPPAAPKPAEPVI